jgi:hypothetical protein
MALLEESCGREVRSRGKDMKPPPPDRPKDLGPTSLRPTGRQADRTESDNKTLRAYFARLGDAPLLTHEGEIEFAKRVEGAELEVARALLSCPPAVHEFALTALALRSGEARPREVTRRSAFPGKPDATIDGPSVATLLEPVIRLDGFPIFRTARCCRPYAPNTLTSRSRARSNRCPFALFCRRFHRCLSSVRGSGYPKSLGCREPRCGASA